MNPLRSNTTAVMPLALQLLADRLADRLARALLLRLARDCRLSFSSSVDAAASTSARDVVDRPARRCACAERNTDRRGRSAVPLTRLRMRDLALDALAGLLAAESSTCPAMTHLRRAGLAGLAHDRLFDVLDALALVRLGRTEAADLRRRVAERLAVDARQDQRCSCRPSP